MSEQNHTKKEESRQDGELRDEQLESAAGGAPASKWVGEAEKSQPVNIP